MTQPSLALRAADGNPPPQQGADQSFHLPPMLLQYWQTMLRWRWLMLGIVATCLALGLIATLLTAPKYSAKTQIQIDRQQKQVTKVDGLDAQTASQDIEFYATQYALLKARPLAERVATELKLFDSKDFFAAHGIDSEELFSAPGKTAAQLQIERRRIVVNLLLDNVSISPVRGSKLVDIIYTSRNAALSTAIANKWAAAFIALSMDRQFNSTADARSFLEERIAALRQKVEDSERAAVLYASQSGIVNFDKTIGIDGKTISNRTLASVALEQLAVALNQATADRIAAQSRLNRSGGGTTEAVTSPTLSSLRQQRAAAAAQLAKLSVQFAPEYPSVMEASDQVAAIDAAIRTETARITEARNNEYREALMREKSLKVQVATLTTELDRQNRANIEYANLQRDADTNRELYNSLLQRYKEIGVAGSVGISNIAIVEPAIIPDKPSSPKMPINLALALLVGLALAFMSALVLEQIDEGIREPSQVEHMLGLPLLGTTPVVDSGDPVAEIRDPKSHLFDAYFSIRSSLAFATNHGFPKSLALVSTRSAEGKSSTSVALAAIIARTDKKVLLIDADMRSPSIHEMVGADNEAGLSNILAGEPDWMPLVQKSSFKNLDVVSAGPTPPSAAELLSGDRLKEFVYSALEKYDHVIVDGPPLLGMTDAQLIARAVEGVVYVVQSAGPAVRTVRASLGRLGIVDAHIFGAILTRLESKAGSYGYGYGYGYGETAESKAEKRAR